MIIITMKMHQSLDQTKFIRVLFMDIKHAFYYILRVKQTE